MCQGTDESNMEPRTWLYLRTGQVEPQQPEENQKERSGLKHENSECPDEDAAVSG